jgi:hypothetical protein
MKLINYLFIPILLLSSNLFCAQESDKEKLNKLFDLNSLINNKEELKKLSEKQIIEYFEEMKVLVEQLKVVNNLEQHQKELVLNVEIGLNFSSGLLERFCPKKIYRHVSEDGKITKEKIIAQINTLNSTKDHKERKEITDFLKVALTDCEYFKDYNFGLFVRTNLWRPHPKARNLDEIANYYLPTA